MPDIEKINNVAVADISKLDSITFADGQKVNNQDVSLATDARVLIEEQTFTNQTTVSFDSLGGTTYQYHMFQLINIHADTNDVQFRFASSVSDDYNWSSFWEYKHNEAGSDDGSHQYAADYDTLLNADDPLANIGRALGNVADESLSGYVYMWGLADEVPRQHAKHWVAITSMHSQFNYHLAGRHHGILVHDGSNSNDSVDQIDFTMSSGTFDGTIRLFGMVLS